VAVDANATDATVAAVAAGAATAAPTDATVAAGAATAALLPLPLLPLPTPLSLPLPQPMLTLPLPMRPPPPPPPLVPLSPLLLPQQAPPPPLFAAVAATPPMLLLPMLQPFTIALIAACVIIGHHCASAVGEYWQSSFHLVAACFPTVLLSWPRCHSVQPTTTLQRVATLPPSGPCASPLHYHALRHCAAVWCRLPRCRAVLRAVRSTAVPHLHEAYHAVVPCYVPCAPPLCRTSTKRRHTALLHRAAPKLWAPLAVPQRAAPVPYQHCERLSRRRSAESPALPASLPRRTCAIPAR
jgi:hypothetical protein